MEDEKPAYWHETEHSKQHRHRNNNYHAGRKAYMITLRIEGMRQMLAEITTVSQQQPPLDSATARRIECWTYGDRALLQRLLLPLVCHRKDAGQYEKQRKRCLEEARKGAVIVSACISKSEQTIFKELQAEGYPVVRVEDNGFPEIYHPSQERIELCKSGKLLIVTPWQYHYRHKDEAVFVAYCKTMNCIAQALCRQKDDWWQT